MSGTGNNDSKKRIAEFLDGLELQELQALSDELGLSVPQTATRGQYIKVLISEKSDELDHFSMAAPYWTMKQQIGLVSSNISNLKSDCDKRLYPLDFVSGLFRTYRSTFLSITALAAVIGYPASQIWTIHNVAQQAEEAKPKLEIAMDLADKLAEQQSLQVHSIAVLLQSDQIDRLTRIVRDIDHYGASTNAIDDSQQLLNIATAVEELSPIIMSSIEHLDMQLAQLEDNQNVRNYEQKVRDLDQRRSSLKRQHDLFAIVPRTCDAISNTAKLFMSEGYSDQDRETLQRLTEQWAALRHEYKKLCNNHDIANAERISKRDTNLMRSTNRMHTYCHYLEGVLLLEEYRRGNSKGKLSNLITAHQRLLEAGEMDPNFAPTRVYQITALRCKMKEVKDPAKQQLDLEEARQCHEDAVRLCKSQSNMPRLVKAHNNFAYLLIRIGNQDIKKGEIDDARLRADEAKIFIDKATEIYNPDPIIYTTLADLQMLNFKLAKARNNEGEQKTAADEVIAAIKNAVENGFRGYGRYGRDELLGNDEFYKPLVDYDDAYEEQLVKVLGLADENSDKATGTIAKSESN